MMANFGYIEVSVFFKSIIYESHDFAIFNAHSDEYGEFAAKGKIFHQAKHLLKTKLTLVGEFQKNEKYGGQDFSFTQYIIEGDQLYHFLVNIVGYITASSARELCNKFGDKIDKVISESPDDLLIIKGIGPNKLSRIVERWHQKRHLFNLSKLLSPIGVKSYLINRIHDHFGQAAYDIILKNPYKLVRIHGIGFKLADQLARKIGIPVNSPARISACAEYCLITKNNGSTTQMPKHIISNMLDELKSGIDNMPVISILECQQGIADLIEENLAKFTLRKRLRNANLIESIANNSEIAMATYFEYEKEIYMALKAVKKGKPIVEDIHAWITQYEHENKVVFGEEQKSAISLANEMYSLFSISGYAGTGKTTTSKAILALMTQRIHKEDIVCCALAGIAAKRVEMQSGFPAFTIHSLLGYKETDWTYNHHNKLTYKLILLDESSMVDVELLYRLIQAIDFNNTTLIMLGDPAQLPPVGLGQPYTDILAFQKIKNVTLTRIYRQSEDAVITAHAEKVRNGTMPDLQKNYEDFYWHESTNTANESNNVWIEQTIISLAENAKPDMLQLIDAQKYWQFITRFQVVAPVHKTEVGVTALNTKLQQVFNPLSGAQITRSADRRTFRVNDKVVHLKNMWICSLNESDKALWRTDELLHREGDERVMNGQLGIVSEVKDDQMLVFFPIENYEVLYKSQMINEYVIDLAYALTVHKTQGSEYDQVVMPMTNSHYMMLKPKLIYTAMTRAKNRLDLVGQYRAFSTGILRKDDSRSTCLQTWFKKQTNAQISS